MARNVQDEQKDFLGRGLNGNLSPDVLTGPKVAELCSGELETIFNFPVFFSRGQSSGEASLRGSSRRPNKQFAYRRLLINDNDDDLFHYATRFF